MLQAEQRPEDIPPPSPGRSSKHTVLTARQRDICRLVPAGSPVPEIALSLFVAESTVRSHVRGLLKRTGSRNITALAAWCEAHWSCCVWLLTAYPPVNRLTIIRSDEE
jgi:DNA-binding NarL/FixJ family response regulator